MSSSLRRLVAACVVLFVLAGCGKTADKPVFLATDITGSTVGGDFRLTDPAGRARTLGDFKGKVVVLFFGYTHCPDVCPTTLGELTLAMKKLGKEAGRVQVIFVTLDPERDTPALLDTYVKAFDGGFLGLSGNDQSTARVAREFKVFYQKQPGANPNQYTLDHSAGTYVLDPAGRVRLFVASGQGADVFVHDIRALLG